MQLDQLQSMIEGCEQREQVEATQLVCSYNGTLFCGRLPLASVIATRSLALPRLLYPILDISAITSYS